MLKILLLQPFKDSDKDYLLKNLSDKYEIIIPKSYSEDELLKAINDVEIVISSKISEQLLQNANKLKIIQTIGTGIDSYPLKKLKEKNIILCNSRAHSKYVAEFGVAMLMSLIKKIHLHDRLMRDGIWWRPHNDSTDKNYLSTTLIEKKVGFIGFGNIGQYIAKFLYGFDIKIFAFDKYSKIHFNNLESITQFMSLEEVVKNSDYLFITLPLTDKTKWLINKEIFSVANKNSLWVHISRGPVIHEEALYNALVNNLIGGIAIDNWFSIPQKVDDRIYPSLTYEYHKFDNVLLSPYRALYIAESSPHLIDVVNNLTNYVNHGKLFNIIDYDKGF